MTDISLESLLFSLDETLAAVADVRQDSVEHGPTWEAWTPRVRGNPEAFAETIAMLDALIEDGEELKRDVERLIVEQQKPVVVRTVRAMARVRWLLPVLGLGIGLALGSLASALVIGHQTLATFVETVVAFGIVLGCLVKLQWDDRKRKKARS